MEWQRDLLLQEIKELQLHEGDSEEIRDKLEEQYRILSLLEEQVAIKQEEWELQIDCINQEKSEAINVARYATQKLIETINDFQHQSENQKDYHSRILKIIHHNNEYIQDENTELCPFITEI